MDCAASAPNRESPLRYGLGRGRCLALQLHRKRRSGPPGSEVELGHRDSKLRGVCKRRRWERGRSGHGRADGSALTEKLMLENCFTNGFIHASSCLWPPFTTPLQDKRERCRGRFCPGTPLSATPNAQVPLQSSLTEEPFHVSHLTATVLWHGCHVPRKLQGERSEQEADAKTTHRAAWQLRSQMELQFGSGGSHAKPKWKRSPCSQASPRLKSGYEHEAR